MGYAKSTLGFDAKKKALCDCTNHCAEIDNRENKHEKTVHKQTIDLTYTKL